MEKSTANRLFKTPSSLAGTVSAVLRAVNRTAFGENFGLSTTFRTRHRSELHRFDARIGFSKHRFRLPALYRQCFERSTARCSVKIGASYFYQKVKLSDRSWPTAAGLRS